MQGRWEAAISAYQQAEELARRGQHPGHLAWALRRLAQCEISTRDLSAALSHTDQAVQASSTLDDKAPLFDALDIRAQVLIARGDFAAAAESLDRAFALRDMGAMISSTVPAFAALVLLLLFTPSVLAAEGEDPSVLLQRATARIEAAVDHYRKTGDFKSSVGELAPAQGELEVAAPSAVRRPVFLPATRPHRKMLTHKGPGPQR